MKFVDEYRDAQLAQQYAEAIASWKCLTVNSFLEFADFSEVEMGSSLV